MHGRWELVQLCEPQWVDTNWRHQLQLVEELRFGFIFEGSAFWYLNQTEYSVYAGDVVVILPGTYRASYTTCPFQHSAVRLTLRTGHSRQSSASLPSLPQWLRLPPRIPLGKEDVAELFSFLRYAEDEMRQGRPGAEEMVDAYIRQFLVMLYRRAVSPRCRQPEHTQSRGPSAAVPGLTKALEFIHEHLDRPIYVRDIAKACGYSEPHLRRLFREHLGMSPGEYLKTQRIEVAKQLLRTGRFTVCEVAEKVGFSDPYYFSRTFKSVVYVSPREYLQKCAM